MTAKRTPIGGGKYCYAGPNCRLHSATGVLAARKLRDEAVTLYAGATTLGEMTRAQEALEKASVAYDATQEGQTALHTELADAKDPLAKVALRRRLLAAQSYEEAVEQDAQYQARLEERHPELAGLQDGIKLSSATQARAFEKKHNLGTHEIVDPAAYSPWAGNLSEGIYGAKAAKTKLMPLLKAAQKEGYLPSNVKYSVRVDYNSIYITVQGLKDKAIGVTGPDGYIERGDEHPEIRQLQSRLETITDSLNYNRSNGQVDYFNSGFYANIKVEDERARKYRFDEANRQKEVRETNQKAKEAQEAVRAAGYDKSVLLSKSRRVNVSSGPQGESIYQYGDSKLFVIADEDGQPYAAYNMAGFSAKSEDSSQSETEVIADAVLRSATGNSFTARRSLARRRVEFPRQPVGAHS